MIHSKLLSILSIVALAGIGGCALETPASESGSGDDTQQSQADLKKATPQTQGVEALTAEPTGGEVRFEPKPLNLVNTIKTDNLLGTPGEDEGPRPHPWQPAPESEGSGSTSGTTSTTNSNTGNSSSDKPAK